jgi:hypothetical protein
MNFYTVKRSRTDFTLSKDSKNPEWEGISILTINNFLPESSNHRPITEVKLLHDDRSIIVFFKVKDRYVRCTNTGHQPEVWNDSCVEWFAQPRPDKGYFAFEINCGGNLHASYIEDPARQPDRSLKKSTPLPYELYSTIAIFHSLPSMVKPEISDPIEWSIELSVPVAVFEHFLGPLGNIKGQEWQANFNKCGDKTSHPHWATWNPVAEKNFHRPQDFGKILFC